MTFILIIEASVEDLIRPIILQRVSYIRYLIRFKEKMIQVLLNYSSKVNAMSSTYAANLNLHIQKTNIRAQKIDGSILGTYTMVIDEFFLQDKWGRNWFFKEIFLLADVSVKVILGILLLFLSDANVQFSEMRGLT